MTSDSECPHLPLFPDRWLLPLINFLVACCPRDEDADFGLDHHHIATMLRLVRFSFLCLVFFQERRRIGETGSKTGDCLIFIGTKLWRSISVDGNRADCEVAWDCDK